MHNTYINSCKLEHLSDILRKVLIERYSQQVVKVMKNTWKMSFLYLRPKEANLRIAQTLHDTFYITADLQHTMPLPKLTTSQEFFPTRSQKWF